MRPAVPVLLIAFLLTAGVADAKRVQKARVCGASECFTFNRANSGGKLMLFEEWGAIRSAPSSAAPWYRLRISFVAEGDEPVKPFTVSHAYVPSADLLRVRDDQGVIRWLAVNDDLRPVLAQRFRRAGAPPGRSTARHRRPGHADGRAAGTTGSRTGA